MVGRLRINAGSSFTIPTPDLPNTPSADAGRSPTWAAIQRLRKENKLTPAQGRLSQQALVLSSNFMISKTIPFELVNLASNEAHENILSDLKSGS